MRICMTQNESVRFRGKGEQRQTTQVDPRWHECPAKEQAGRIVSKEIKRVGWLIVREFDDSWIGNPGISLLNPRCPAKMQPSDRGPSFEMSRARCIPLQCAIDSGVAVT